MFCNAVTPTLSLWTKNKSKKIIFYFLLLLPATKMELATNSGIVCSNLKDTHMRFFGCSNNFGK